MKNSLIIIGSGASGLSLACLLSELDLKITIIERAKLEQLENPPYDGRETALTHPSKNLLEKIGVWEKIDKKSISKIEKAQVFNLDDSQILDFNNDSNKDALGYLVSNSEIKRALFEVVKTLPNVEIITETEVEDIKTDNEKARVFLKDLQQNKTQNDENLDSQSRVLESALVLAADSRFSKSRYKMGISCDIHDFAKNMIVCKMAHERTHQNIALEYFFDDRVMAVLPLQGDFSSVVITVPAKEAEELVALSEEEFNKNIENYLGKKLGKFMLKSQRFSYPLISIYADKFIATRFALIGDAAVGMHPVTAHGYNLGLLGQNSLSEEIKKALKSGADIGSPQLLEKYNLNHIKETKLMYRGTNMIVDLFTNNSKPAKLLRKFMIKTANSKFLPFKSIITNGLEGKSRFEGLFSLLKK